MNELDFINNIRKIVTNPSALNLDDDVFFDKKRSIVASIDTYNEKIHYLNFKNPELVTKKVIRASISDIISKGVDPKYLLISFSGNKKHLNVKNVKKILKSIKQEQKKYNFSLIGGDTTFSSLSSFSICSLGYSNKIIKRNTCKQNDDIYLTGNLGDSSIGLNSLKNKIKLNSKLKKYFENKYFMSNLAFGFHRDLKKFASSSMDVSDGLLIDLKKMLTNSKLSYIVDFDLIPKSTYFNKLIKQKKIFPIKYLFKGDDYQILFTAKKKYRINILKYAKKWNQKISRIGNITKARDNYLKYTNILKKIEDYQGYIHNFR